MFSTIPYGETPVSKSSVRSRPSFVIRTSAENPGSAISASGTDPPVASTETRGKPPASAFGQLSRVTGPASAISGSVTLSIRIVSRTWSTGSSSISVTRRHRTRPVTKVSSPAPPRQRSGRRAGTGPSPVPATVPRSSSARFETPRPATIPPRDRAAPPPSPAEIGRPPAGNDSALKLCDDAEGGEPAGELVELGVHATELVLAVLVAAHDLRSCTSAAAGASP